MYSLKNSNSFSVLILKALILELPFNGFINKGNLYSLFNISFSVISFGLPILLLSKNSLVFILFLHISMTDKSETNTLAVVFPSIYSLF